MPAGSEPSGAEASGRDLPALPHTWRPLGPRLAAGIFGAVLLAVCLVGWFTLGEEIRDKFTLFQRGTIAVLGAMGYAVMYGLARCRVVAQEQGVLVVNGFRRHELAWAQILGVRLPPGAPWVTLDLSDGSTLSVMAIQGSDGPRATQAAAELRALVDLHSR